MATPAFKQKAAEQGAMADYLAPTALGDLSCKELVRWGEVVKSAHIEGD
jgi:tripartite-type tricarboxylate transporter receptor subunit TctC